MESWEGGDGGESCKNGVCTCVCVCVKAKCVWSAQVEKKKLMNEKYREAEEDAQREYKVHEY